MITYLLDFATAMWALRWWWLTFIVVIAGLVIFTDDRDVSHWCARCLEYTDHTHTDHTV